MSFLSFNNIGIKTLSATVPHTVVDTINCTNDSERKRLEKFISITGIEQRHIATNGICTSDLCFKSAEDIFANSNIDRKEIDALIFISQTPDYMLPATSSLLQDRLSLRNDIITYDINLSCSGFIHGLMLAYTFLCLPSINNVMILAGDTLSHLTSDNDNGIKMTIGDAGSAAVVGKGNQFGKSFFSMNSDGHYYQSAFVPTETGRERAINTTGQVSMNSDDVFGYAISAIPKDIRQLLFNSGYLVSDIDKFVFSEVNNLLVDNLCKKVGADKHKILHSVSKFGNTESASIPLCMAYNKGLIKGGDVILMSAFGAGFIYGSAILNIADCSILNLNEV